MAGLDPAIHALLPTRIGPSQWARSNSTMVISRLSRRRPDKQTFRRWRGMAGNGMVVSGGQPESERRAIKISARESEQKGRRLATHA